MSWIEEDDKEIINTNTVLKSQSKYAFIAPGQKGDPELERDINDPIRIMHDQLDIRLASTSLLIIAGFSLRDPYINKRLDAALNKQEKLKVAYVNPFPPQKGEPEYPDLLDKYSSRVRIIKHSFAELQARLALAKMI